MLKYENVNTGLLIIRLGLGIMFVLHGFPKITGGTESWQKIGDAMGHIGIHFLPVFWGFMAAVSEFGGGILLILGVLWKPACLLLIITMSMAVITHLSGGEGFNHYAEAMEAGIVFIGLFFTGPGKYRAGKKLFSK